MTRIVRPLLGALLCAPTAAQVTQRVSVGPGGVQANADSRPVSISADGRYVAFPSAASNLVASDLNAAWDAFVRDRRLGVTELVSVDSNGVQGNGDTWGAHLSGDGRFVVFRSASSNLVPGDTNDREDVFVRDRLIGTTERVNLGPGGVEADADSYEGPITPDGRLVVFAGPATNLVAGGTNGFDQIFLRDRPSGTTELVSVNSNEVQGNGDSYGGSISDDGRFVAFVSAAHNLVPGDTNVRWDVFVRDRVNGTTERVSVDSNGAQTHPIYNIEDAASISGDGRFVAFNSSAPDFVPGDTNQSYDVFVRDLSNDTTEVVSVSTNGVLGDSLSFAPSISADGRHVAFYSDAENLVPEDAGWTDVFVRDRQAGMTERVSVDSSGAHRDGYSYYPSISANGRFVAFSSDSEPLVPGDTNDRYDIFVRDRLGGTSFTSLCDPGAGGVIGCPCANPPAGSGRGCENSSATGGATLSASGGTFLTSDSLVFTTSGETPAALSILMQADGVTPGGVVHGQGVSCVGGANLRRLFIETAQGGSITVPDFDAGDPTVSARSAARGDAIQAGQSRWYLVVYRDPVVLGSCPLSSTFNTTHTGRVTWAP